MDLLENLEAAQDKENLSDYKFANRCFLEGLGVQQQLSTAT
jgi:hypothetical protein